MPPANRHGTVLLLVMLCLLPVRAFPAFSCRLWQTDDGLPHNSVQSILQTQDGYLWLGTQGGLVQFDGYRLRPAQTNISTVALQSSIMALCETGDGTLWVGTDQGLFRREQGAFVQHGNKDILGTDVVRALHEARDGSLWIGTSAGTTRWHMGKFARFTENEGVAHSIVRAITSDKNATIWIATALGLNRFKEGKMATLRQKGSGILNNSVKAVCGDRSGRVWIGSDGGLTLLQGGKVVRHYTKKDGLSDNFVSALFEDHAGTLWIGTYGGLNRLLEDRIVTEFNPTGDPFDLVNCIFEDREKNIWVGTRGGLNRLNPRRFTAVTKQEGLAHNTVVSICQDQSDAIWIGTWGGGLNRLADGNVTAFTTTNGLSSDLILALGPAREDGTLWIGTDFLGGLNRFQNGAISTVFTNEPVGAAIMAICEDHERNLWLGTRTGVHRLRNGRWSHYASTNGLAGDSTRAILTQRDGTVWVGTEGGLSRWNGSTFSNLTVSDGLGPKDVRALFADREGRLWAGTKGGGLFKIEPAISSTPQTTARPSITSYTTRQGLFSDDIFEILEDDLDYLWMSCNKGIFRVSKTDFDNVDAGKLSSVNSIVYGKADGMVSIDCKGVAKPSAWKTRDGRLWFATGKGLVAAEPSIPINTSAPPVVIEEVIADNNVMTDKRSGDRGSENLASLVIPPGRGDLQFHYTALSFTAPEKNQFKYKLDGVDADWVHAGTRRVAYYNNLSPGTYHFRVIACNNDGVWNPVGAGLKLSLQPRFWQTWWFFSVSTAAAIAMVGGSSRYLTQKRLQREMRRIEQQHSIEKERTRIAQDMHDEIGAKLTKISFLTELAKRQLPHPAEAERQMDNVSRTARDVLHALDEIVWAVNPKNDTLDNLATYICRHASDFFENTSVLCHFDIPAHLPHVALSTNARHNLFLAVKEALNNILKHACATQVTIKLSAAVDRSELTITDNGCGFCAVAAPAVDSPTRRVGNGLGNMRYRLDQIGGRCDVQSQPGQGTIVHFILPLTKPAL
jgi:ligand-binding sensor domain-containing protein/signal transduction histidine kinase